MFARLFVFLLLSLNATYAAAQSTDWGGSGPPVLFDTKGPQAADVHQGPLGDCYLMASLAAVAITQPQVLKQSVSMTSSGARVRLFLDADKGRFKSDWVTVNLKPRTEHVFSSVDKRGHAIVWVGVFELAFAQWLEEHHLNAKGQKLEGDGLNAIGEGGYPQYVLTALTGHAAMNAWTNSLSDSQLRWLLTQPRARHRTPVVASSNPARVGWDLKPRHAYTVLGVTTDGTGVMLRDPSFRQPQAEGLVDPQVLMVSLDDFRRSFPMLTFQAAPPRR